METPTTTSCFRIKRRRYKSRKVDRFSDLPYNVYDIIFSFLGMREFIRLSVCSKRLREICYSLQCVTFESSESNRKIKDEEFLSYSRFLIDRGDRNLNHLCISWELDGNPWENIPNEKFIYCVSTWIHYAISCNLKILHFQFTGERNLPIFSLPHCLFSCQTLKSMTIDLNGSGLNFPSSTGFVNRRNLVLKGVIISDEKSSANLFSSLRSLKGLWLENIGGIKTMEVNSSSLETLYLDWNCTKVLGYITFVERGAATMFMNARERSNNTQHKASLKISAPNLTDFEWRGNIVPRNCILDRFIKLDDATVVLALKKFDDPQYLCKAICSLSDAKHLRLNVSSITVQGVDVNFWGSQNLTFVHKLQIAEIELLN